MTDSDREYHINIAPGEIPPLVLLPGDPDRSKKIAETFFDNPEEVAKKREYWSFRGTYKGTPVAVCSTGIGCPSAAIAIEELIKVGCHTFVRVGTAGAIDSSLSAGDVVIFSGAVRDDGTSRQYAPIEYPAISNPDLLFALMKAADERGSKYRVGIGHSKDSFYSEYPEMVADPISTKAKWDSYRRAKVLATEMESAALFVIGQMRGVRVGTACVIVGEPIEKEAKIVGKPKLDDLVNISLQAMISLQ
ncbi:MAG: nucleoside phosphorylase [Candidatus Thorarchaeota archaeon]|jgi:uridine phosphorylase